MKHVLCNVMTFAGLEKYCPDKDRPVPKVIETLFQEHLAEFGKSYATQEEYQFRLNLFADKHAELA
jgi:hypothetical protein